MGSVYGEAANEIDITRNVEDRYKNLAKQRAIIRGCSHITIILPCHPTPAP